MNKTNFEHAGFALLMMLPFVLLGNPLAGAAFGIAFFLGREHAQFQVLLKDYTLRGTFKAFDMRKWSLDAQLDLVFPIVACALAYIGLRYVGYGV
jgi:hypothetical protein